MRLRHGSGVRPARVGPRRSARGDDRPDYPYAEDVTLRAYELDDGAEVTVTVPGLDGEVAAEFAVVRDGGTLTATRQQGAAAWGLASGPTAGASRVPAEGDQGSVDL